MARKKKRVKEEAPIKNEAPKQEEAKQEVRKSVTVTATDLHGRVVTGVVGDVIKVGNVEVALITTPQNERVRIPKENCTIA